MAEKPLKSITFPGLPDKYTIPQVDDTLTVAGSAADAAATGAAIAAEAAAREAADEEIAGAVDDLKSAMSLFDEFIAGTVQSVTFDASGNVQTITHTNGAATVRTDSFTFATNTITEVRTLATGESLTIVTNLTTLETTVTYAAA